MPYEYQTRVKDGGYVEPIAPGQVYLEKGCEIIKPLKFQPN